MAKQSKLHKVHDNELKNTITCMLLKNYAGLKSILADKNFNEQQVIQILSWCYKYHDIAAINIIAEKYHRTKNQSIINSLYTYLINNLENHENKDFIENITAVISNIRNINLCDAETVYQNFLYFYAESDLKGLHENINNPFIQELIQQLGLGLRLQLVKRIMMTMFDPKFKKKLDTENILHVIRLMRVLVDKKVASTASYNNFLQALIKERKYFIAQVLLELSAKHIGDSNLSALTNLLLSLNFEFSKSGFLINYKNVSDQAKTLFHKTVDVKDNELLTFLYNSLYYSLLYDLLTENKIEIPYPALGELYCNVIKRYHECDAYNQHGAIKIINNLSSSIYEIDKQFFNEAIKLAVEEKTYYVLKNMLCSAGYQLSMRDGDALYQRYLREKDSLPEVELNALISILANGPQEILIGVFLHYKDYDFMEKYLEFQNNLKNEDLAVILNHCLNDIKETKSNSVAIVNLIVNNIIFTKKTNFMMALEKLNYFEKNKVFSDLSFLGDYPKLLNNIIDKTDNENIKAMAEGEMLLLTKSQCFFMKKTKLCEGKSAVYQYDRGNSQLKRKIKTKRCSIKINNGV